MAFDGHSLLASCPLPLPGGTYVLHIELKALDAQVDVALEVEGDVYSPRQGTEAAAMGMINRAVPAGELSDVAYALAREYAAQAASEATE